MIFYGRCLEETNCLGFQYDSHGTANCQTIRTPSGAKTYQSFQTQSGMVIFKRGNPYFVHKNVLQIKKTYKGKTYSQWTKLFKVPWEFSGKFTKWLVPLSETVGHPPFPSAGPKMFYNNVSGGGYKRAPVLCASVIRRLLLN